MNKIAMIEQIKEGSFGYDDQKIKTAFALNLCTVSVSQIIDYKDVVVLEQEYDAILNNLNLESIPKDEALLDILKQLLDTITFFRMQEGDKEFIDKEYQNKMKNAIWSAVPNIGFILSTGNPVVFATSLASQVGIGYMNYRKTKAANKLDYEKQQWELRKTAIEQFNGLRRELFDTAWRLVDAHEIPDEYRLTERQVTQYNNILMDPDAFRRYERLDSIKDRLPIVVLRPTGVYGPREKDYYMMAKSIKSHVDFSVGYKRQDITFVYVKDVVNAVFLALERGESGRKYFLSDGNIYQSSSFSNLIHKELGSPWWIRIKSPLFILKIITTIGEYYGRVTGRVTALNNDKYNILSQRNWQCDITPTIQELGYKPEYNLERGVKETIAWYKENNWL